MNTRSSRPQDFASLLMAAAAGAVAMYALDPQQGRRRRALGRDRALHLQHRARNKFGIALRDLRHRLRGWAARVRGARRHDPVDDAVLVERVRSALGRTTSHPHAVRVAVTSSRVVLSGPVYDSEADRIVAAVSAVPDVRAVECRLERHAEDDDVPALRGRRNQAPAHGRPAYWPPGTRLLALATGVALAASGMAARRRSVAGLALVGAGAALATRAIANNRPGAIGDRMPREPLQTRRRSAAPADTPTKRADATVET